MERKVILLGGGTDAVEITQRAVDMDLHVTVVDRDPDCPGRDLADDFANVSCYDPDLVVDCLHDRFTPYHAVLCAGTDAVLTMAAVALAFDLVGPTMQTAAKSMDKYTQALYLQVAGVPVPETWSVARPDQHFLYDYPLPAVLKPIVNRGARGVVRVTAHNQWDRRYAQALAHAPDGRVMGQAWVDGVQLSSESLVQDGDVLWTAFSERNYDRLDETYPYVVEDGGDLPPALVGNYDVDWKLEAHLAVQGAVSALGLEHGTLKGDLVWDGRVMHVVEVAPRLSGGKLCSVQVPMTWGVDFVGLALRVALGEHVDPREIRPRLLGYTCQRFEFPLGDGTTCHPERGGSVIAQGSGRKEAQNAVAVALVAQAAYETELR